MLIMRDSATIIVSHIDMIDSFKLYAIPALCVILLVPCTSIPFFAFYEEIGGFYALFGIATLTLTIAAGLFWEPMQLILKTISELKDAANGDTYPDWITECVDESVDLN